jgi:hypothetical protein
MAVPAWMVQGVAGVTDVSPSEAGGFGVMVVERGPHFFRHWDMERRQEKKEWRARRG